MLRKLLYPIGKVHPMYPNYLKWSFVNNMVIGIESVMSTHSILSVINMNTTSNVLTGHYMSRYVIGQTGSIFFVQRFGKYADKQTKKFAYISMSFQQLCPYIECATPFLPFKSFVYVSGMANIMKNMSFTGMGSVTTKCIQILAKGDNNAEIYAKISVINTLGNTVGMIFGICIVNLIPCHITRYSLLPILFILRIISFRKSIKNIIT